MGHWKRKNFSLDNDMQVYGNDATGGLVGYANSSTIKGDIGDLNFSSIPLQTALKATIRERSLLREQMEKVRLWEDSSGMPYILIWIIFVSQVLFLVVTEWVESSGI